MTYPVIQPSFANGELSPYLFSRVDLEQYRTGVARAYNFFVDFRGGLSNRPATQYLIHAYDQGSRVRLIPFQFSIVQGYALEFGQLYMRPLMNGGTILEATKAITGITQANPAVVTANAHGFSAGQPVFIAGVVGMTQVNGRYFVTGTCTTNTFVLNDTNGTPVNSIGYSAYASGGTVARVYQIVSPFAAADLARVKYTQSADVLTLTHPSYPPYYLTRTGHTAWAFSTIPFGSSMAAPVNVTLSADSTGGNTLSYRVTSVGPNGEESVPSNVISVGVDTNANIQLLWNGVAGAVSYNIYRATLTAPVYSAGAYSSPYTGYGFLDFALGTKYADSAILANVIRTLPDFTQTPPTNKNPFAVKAITYVAATAGGSSYTNATVITVTDSTGTGAVLRPVIVNGALNSVIVEKGGSGYTAPSLAFSVGTGATATVTLSPASGTYPGVASYFQQRAVFAATVNAPQSFWMTKPGAFTNMDIANPVLSDDAITATIVGQQVNEIRSLVPMPGGLIAFTGDGAWEISGGGTGQPITPLSVVAKPQAYIGASYLQPIVINYDVLYAQNKGGSVRDLAFNFYYNAYTADDISILSNHLVFGYQITEWAWAQDPFRVIWAIRSDGKMLSLTYVKEQKVFGWAQHETNGIFESVCSISEGEESAVYFVVRRTVNAQVHRFIERMYSRNFNSNIVNARFLDSGLDYSGVAITTVSGLEHLEGATVSALGDGIEYTGLVVTNGRVTLPLAAVNITVGLPMTAEIQTMPLDTQVQAGTSQGRRKKISALTARILQSRGLQIGSSFSTLTNSKVSTTPVVNSPFGSWTNGLFTGDDRNLLDPIYTELGQVCIRQSHPFPATILGVIPFIAIGDTP